MGQLMAENNSLIEIHEGRKHIYYLKEIKQKEKKEYYLIMIY